MLFLRLPSSTYLLRALRFCLLFSAEVASYHLYGMAKIPHAIFAEVYLEEVQ